MPAARGDVVIRTSSRGKLFTLETFPDRPQISVKSYQEALRLASAFSQKYGATIWLVDQRGVFTKAPSSPGG